MALPVTCEIPKEVYRLGRRDHLLTFSHIAPEDAALRGAGNRFDVLGAGVLYLASTRIACFAETLCCLRPTPRMFDLLKDGDGSHMTVGSVPANWRLQRTVGTIGVANALDFLDLVAPETQAFLSKELSSELIRYGSDKNLDISTVCNDDRRISRAIANWAYTARTEVGEPLYGGIRYVSKVEPGWECWAMFAGPNLTIDQEESIEVTDPDLREMARIWDLIVH